MLGSSCLQWTAQYCTRRPRATSDARAIDQLMRGREARTHLAHEWRRCQLLPPTSDAASSADRVRTARLVCGLSSPGDVSCPGTVMGAQPDSPTRGRERRGLSAATCFTSHIRLRRLLRTGFTACP
ncbi:hypothetical protein C8Q76DRAFT_292006 [Earliella scabrosa]|nr:hypothetical protein C8Q76DRAFT_292006 [Earliella scabrosa]